MFENLIPLSHVTLVAFYPKNNWTSFISFIQRKKKIMAVLQIIELYLVVNLSWK